MRLRCDNVVWYMWGMSHKDVSKLLSRISKACMRHNLKRWYKSHERVCMWPQIAIQFITSTRSYAFTLIFPSFPSTNKIVGSHCFYLCVPHCDIINVAHAERGCTQVRRSLPVPITWKLWEITDVMFLKNTKF